MEKHERIDRKLAAILAADVVGYSRLMGADEVGTLLALKATRKEIFDPAIRSHFGRIVKTTGDGLLTEFQSVVDAVACACTIQRRMLDRNRGIADDKRLVFRIGINVGDIIIDRKDLFGDGVNVAARLETICEPGGLCISEIAHDQVRDKLPLTFADGGEQQVKNIARPVRVFCLSPQTIGETPELGLDRAAPARRGRRPLLAAAVAAAVIVAGGAAWWAMRPTAPAPASTLAKAAPSPSADTRPSIAVLPLVLLGADSKEDYFADGMTEDIISALGRFPEFVVSSRNAVFSYKGKTPKPEDVGRDLDVRYLVEGSIRRSPERIRVAISLAAAGRGIQLWSENYDIAPKEIFTVQDDITRRIAGTLASRLTGLELAKAASKPPSSLETYDLVLRGRDMLGRGNRSANSQARALFKRAIELDSNYARAYIGLGQVELNAVINGWTADPDAAAQRAEGLGQKAISIDPTDAAAHVLLGSSYLRYGDYDRALDEMQQAIKLNSSDPDAYSGLATALLWSGDVETAVKDFETAAKLGRDFDVNESFTLGISYLLSDRHEDAVRVLERSTDRSKTDPFTRAILAAAYSELGRQDDAQQ